MNVSIALLIVIAITDINSRSSAVDSLRITQSLAAAIAIIIS